MQADSDHTQAIPDEQVHPARMKLASALATLARPLDGLNMPNVRDTAPAEPAEFQ